MNQFIHDMIHMTEGEKLITYWWLYLFIVVICSITLFIYQEYTSK